ncbi:unnamed protein product [Linum trigynum]|uniref:t-SNARE coiled-coil homology domain-containing protein n=1 Tax=Linum trigynum TaxID=586398 RepID=A0AAV2EAA3_9ROSI
MFTRESSQGTMTPRKPPTTPSSLEVGGDDELGKQIQALVGHQQAISSRIETQDVLNREHEATLEHLHVDVGQLQRGHKKFQDGHDRLQEEIDVKRVDHNRLANDV